MLIVVVPNGHMQAVDADTGAPLPHAPVVTHTGQYAGIVG